MTLVPDTLAGRTIAVLLIALGAFHAFSLWLYDTGSRAEIGYTNERQLAERLIAIKRAIHAEPVAARDRLAHSLSGGAIETHWGPMSLIADTHPRDPASIALKAHLIELVPEIAADGLRISISHERDVGATKHAIGVSVRLPDASWINFSVADPDGPSAAWYGILLSTTVMALAVLVGAVVVVRSVTAPLRVVAQAARRLGTDPAGPPILERGPREVRDAAAAFNDMRRRITRLVEDRARTLAAVSHDLRTPLTRLRFRAEMLDDQDARASITADLAEMDAMVDAVLAFLRGEAETEGLRSTDLTSLCATICDDLADRGHDVSLARTEPMVVSVRRLMLKRAIGNLVANGVKHGGRVRVSIEDRGGQVAVIVDDDGPGIPPAHLDDVFEPFKRLGDASAQEGGGVGLGLTVARTAARAHGGDVRLRNRAEGGLRAELVLPH